MEDERPGYAFFQVPAQLSVETPHLMGLDDAKAFGISLLRRERHLNEYGEGEASDGQFMPMEIVLRDRFGTALDLYERRRGVQG